MVFRLRDVAIVVTLVVTEAVVIPMIGYFHDAAREEAQARKTNPARLSAADSAKHP